MIKQTQQQQQQQQQKQEKKIVFTGKEAVSLTQNLNLREYKTGTILDELFIPALIEGSFVNITGAPDTGKSLLVKHIALYRSQFERVLFITTELPVPYLMKSIELIIKLYPKANLDNLVFLDATNPDPDKTLQAIVAEKLFPRTVIIDSLTGFYENLENKARTVVRRFYNFFKASKIPTTVFAISQKRSSHEETSEEGAGGMAVAHISDVNIVLAKTLIEKQWQIQKFGMPEGEIVRFIRVSGSRFSMHRTEWMVFRITSDLRIEKMKLVKVE